MKRQAPELEEARAVNLLKLLMLGWEGSLLSAPNIRDSHRAVVRTATTAARRALDRGQAAHQVVLECLAPVFAADPGARVKPDYYDGAER